jgi:glycosyltransferase involved in cell wall biosynthesis
MNKSTVFALCHITPPIHGAAAVGDKVVEFIEGNSAFDLIALNLSASKSIADFNASIFTKLFKVMIIIFKSLSILFFFRPKIIYFTPSLNGSSLIRDFFVSILFKLYCKMTNSRLICHIHMRPNTESKFTKNLIAKLLNNSEVILLAESLKKDFSDETLALTKRIYCLSNYVKPLTSNNTMVVNKVSSEISSDLTLLYFGHMIESKGCLRLLYIFKHLLDHNNNNGLTIKLRFVGAFVSSEFNLNFIDMINKLNLVNDVTLENPIYSSTEKSKLFNEIDMLVLPSYSEAFPLTILEAFSVGIPVVATDTGAVSDLISDNLGIAVNNLLDEDEYILNFSHQLSIALQGYSRFNKIDIINSFELINSKLNFEFTLENILRNESE